MNTKNTDYCLLEPITSVEDFLKLQFKSSGNKIKKYFTKAFLNRSFKERSILSLPLNFINDGEINPTYKGSPLEEIYEDAMFYVFSKNPNQFVHPLTYDECDNCLSYLRQIKPELLKINSQNYDRGLLYRLDYETSGVMIYVKNEELYKKLRESFSTSAKEKKYLCWVEGELKLSGSFKHFFDSREEKGKRVVVREEGGGLEGELYLKALEYSKDQNMTLVEVKLATGLRHQIRAQLSHLGYPIIGDTFYGGRKAERLYLHALSYTIIIEGNEFNFHSNPKGFKGL
jgi:23S rRNA pseudouridine1911/1915/1917 synthase